MYEENKKGFSLKDVILQILFVVLFVLILIWLFPTRGSVTTNSEVNDVLLGRIFNENIQTMKDAAINYYTISRMPVKVGTKKTMTLEGMIKNKLILPFKDANGNTCDMTDSYVEVTKYDDEYIMKVNLNCTDDNAYILVYLGCYDYCKGTVCENTKKETVVVKNNTPVCTISADYTVFADKATLTVSSKSENLATKAYSFASNKTGFDTTNTKVVDKTGTYKAYVINKEGKVGNCSITVTKKSDTEYIYQYKKYKYSLVTPESTSWSAWSVWSTNAVTKTNINEVETKTESVAGTKQIQIGTKTVTYADTTKPVYGTVKMLVGTTNYTYCDKYVENITATTSEWIVSETNVKLVDPKDTNTKKYVYKGTTDVNCGDCSNGFYDVYDVLVKNTHVTQNGTTCTSYKTVKTPVYGDVSNVLIGYEKATKTVPLYGTIATTNDVTYYRYRTLVTTSGVTKYSWSATTNDKVLIGKGYKYIGVSDTKWSTISTDKKLINDGYGYTGYKKVK